MIDSGVSTMRTNLRAMKPSRGMPRAGDVFAFQMPDGLYRFGRVIRPDADLGFPAILVYLYRPTSTDLTAVPALRRDDLLVPPLGVARDLWNAGFFQTVRRDPLDPADVWPTHCFFNDSCGRYYDDDGHELPDRHEPCGEQALRFIGGVDREISLALGLPLANDPDELARAERARRDALRALAAAARDLSRRSSPPLRRALATLLDDLAAAGRSSTELRDSTVRDALSDAILDGFVLATTGYALPLRFGLATRRADAAVHAALRRYLDVAGPAAQQLGLASAAERLLAFEDPAVRSADGATYDAYFGSIT
jgi:hypothetical protein